jgi:hypothetical protein
MASEGIDDPCRFWPHPSIDAKAYAGFLTATNNQFRPYGLVLPDNQDSRICGRTTRSIPSNLHGTPNAKLRIMWKSTATTGTARFAYDIQVSTEEVTSEDPTLPLAITGTATDAITGANQKQKADITLTGVSAGKHLLFVIRRRDLADPDTVGADILIEDIRFVADTA